MTFQLDEQFTNFCKAHCPLINFKGIPLDTAKRGYGKGGFNINFPTRSYLSGIHERRDSYAFWVRPNRPCSSHFLSVVGLGRIDGISTLRMRLPMIETLIATRGEEQYAWVLVSDPVSRWGMTRAFFWLRDLLGLPTLIPDGPCSYKRLEEIAMDQQWMPLPNSKSATGAAVSCSYVGKAAARLPNPFEMVSRLEEINPAVVRELMTEKERLEFSPNPWGKTAEQVRDAAFSEACYWLAASAGNLEVAVKAVTEKLAKDSEKYLADPTLAESTARRIVVSAIRKHPHLGRPSWVKGGASGVF